MYWLLVVRFRVPTIRNILNEGFGITRGTKQTMNLQLALAWVSLALQDIVGVNLSTSHNLLANL